MKLLLPSIYIYIYTTSAYSLELYIYNRVIMLSINSLSSYHNLSFIFYRLRITILCHNHLQTLIREFLIFSILTQIEYDIKPYVEYTEQQWYSSININRDTY